MHKPAFIMELSQQIRFLAAGESAVASDIFSDVEIQHLIDISLSHVLAEIPGRTLRHLGRKHVDTGDGIDTDTLTGTHHILIDAWKTKDNVAYYAQRGWSEEKGLYRDEYCPAWYVEVSDSGAETYHISPDGGILLIASISSDNLVTLGIGPSRTLVDTVVARSAQEFTQRLIAREVENADFSLGDLPDIPAGAGCSGL